MDNWLRDFFGSNEWINADFSPAAEVTRDGDDAVVRVELPGVDVEKDVNVELENGQLVIHGERRDEHTEEKNGRTLRELRYGSFRRSFALPSHVDSDAISASYDKGVLTIKVPGAYKDQPLPGAKRIAISK
ncbi:MAG TPA: Hsp20/alpha crystallin family protein [Mycobacterium sp.]|nr:Hsp20/alpha crystallin family protein [Mycobacterium sp.]